MTDDTIKLLELLRKDRRYTVEAYQFVRDALAFAQNELEFGQQDLVEPDLIQTETDTLSEPDSENLNLEFGASHQVERHLTGQQLCQALRIYALEQYGYLAKHVLEQWGLTSTDAIGDIVYNMIDIGLMKKSDQDRREHFDDVFDFQEAFVEQFSIQPEN